ncbi:hypothetical protein D7V83_18510 [bacterium 0.1xD8-71]|nr:hypothetical protein D7V83_18510 [bacterium 0.1xD8-71]
MRIGNNNQGIWQLFRKGTNGNLPFAGTPGNVSKGNEKAIADLLSGRRKNSYGVEGMRITGRTDWKRIINVSDEMKQHVLEDVKKEFYKYGGMSGDNAAETDAYYDKIHSYVKTLKASDRSPATWTLSQLHLDLAHAVTSAVKEKVPGWTNGKPIPSDVLDEIFADESITSMVAGKSGTAKGLDIQI